MYRNRVGAGKRRRDVPPAHVGRDQQVLFGFVSMGRAAESDGPEG
jgi:hypothetical protein